MNKIAAAVLLPVAVAASPAFADAYDCFPMCPPDDVVHIPEWVG